VQNLEKPIMDRYKQEQAQAQANVTLYDRRCCLNMYLFYLVGVAAILFQFIAKYAYNIENVEYYKRVSAFFLLTISILYGIGNVGTILRGKTWFLKNHFLFRDKKKNSEVFCVGMIFSITAITIIHINGSLEGLRQPFLFLLCFYYIPFFSQAILGSVFIGNDAEIYHKELSMNQNPIEISAIISRLGKYMSQYICFHFVGVAVIGTLIAYFFLKINYIGYLSEINNALYIVIIINLLFFICTFGWDCFNWMLFLDKTIMYGKKQAFDHQESLDVSLCEAIFLNNKYIAIIVGCFIYPMFIYLIMLII
jgi:hypothetical protein